MATVLATTAATVATMATKTLAAAATKVATALGTTEMASLLPTVNTTVSSNFTASPSRKFNLLFKKEYHVTWLCFACVIFVANALVLCVFKLDKKLLKRTPANNFLLSLAVNDLLTGLASLLQVLPYLKQQWFQKQPFIYFSIGLDISIMLLSLNSVIHLCLLAAERYLSIFYALQFKGLVTTRRVRYCIISAWAISTIIAVLPFTWMWPLFQDSVSKKQLLKISKIDTYYSALATVAFALIPIILLAIAYVRMFLMCKQLIREAPDNLLARKKTVNKELKILLMYFMMYLVFIVLCVPFFSIRLSLDIYKMLEGRMQLRIPQQLLETFVLARYLASGVNPFIYTFYKQDFRRTIQASFLFSTVCTRFQDTGHVQNGDGNETCTKEIFHSFGTHLSTLKKSPSEIGLVDISANPLNPKKDANGIPNGSNRLVVQQQTRI